MLRYGLPFMQDALVTKQKRVQFLNSKLYTNASAIILKENLPDGSTVWLNPGAVLKYTNPPGSSNREIDFSGEAFFEVARDVKRPFGNNTGLKLSIFITGNI